MSMNVLPVCVYICMYVSMYACTLVQAFGGQKRMSDPLELKLQMVVSHQVLGTKPGSLQEQEVSLATISPAPIMASYLCLWLFSQTLQFGLCRLDCQPHASCSLSFVVAGEHR